MAVYFFILLVSFAINGILIIPFINLLYNLKLQRAHQVTFDVFNNRTPIFDRFHKHKAGTPVGGGLLMLLTTTILFAVSLLFLTSIGRKIFSNYANIGIEISILMFTFVSFSFLGLYDDIRTIFVLSKDKFHGLRMRHKLVLETILAGAAAFLIYSELHVDILNIPFFGVFHLGWLYIPFATFVIVAFANAVNITDGLDGLAGGTLMITLMAFWVISVTILDTPLLIFIAVWLGGLMAFLYFNIHPARLFMGDTGSLAFGATFAIIGLLLGKAFVLPIIGGVFVIEIVSSLLQILSKRFRGKKLFPASPLHLWLQVRGWEEPKIVMRAWLAALLFAGLGLMIAFMK